MDLSNSNNKKFLLFQETEIPKKFLIFSQKKIVLIFSEMETRKKSLHFRRELSESQKQKAFYTLPYNEVKFSKLKYFLTIIIKFFLIL